MTTRGFCRYCERRDAEVYVQPAGRHNDECRECWALYSAIRDWPGRVRGRGNSREALRLALAEIKLPLLERGERASRPTDDSDLRNRTGLGKIREKLQRHPSRASESIERAVEKIVVELS